MKILVCIKSVPIPESDFRLNHTGDFYEEAGLVFQVNEYDLFAVEEAVRIKERFKDSEITVLSVGPARVEAEIKKAMALGADYGFRIDEPRAGSKDALYLAGLIKSWAEDKNFELILCGLISQDLQRGQVGPMLAELLKIPCATAVVALSIELERRRLLCERELEGGLRERVELPLPALLTIQSGINTPRYASLRNVLRVKNLTIPWVSAEALGSGLSCERIVSAHLQAPSAVCEFLKGTPEQIADQLIEQIRTRVHLL